MRPSRAATLFMMLLAVFQLTYFSPRLPERLASHFDGVGRADGWSSKAVFFATNLGIVVVLGVTFLLIAWLMKKAPDSMINLPKKEYWLADERRAATFEYLQAQMEWLGIITLALMLALTQLSIEANLNSTGVMSSTTMWLLFGGYMAFFLIWMIRFIGRWFWAAK